MANFDQGFQGYQGNQGNQGFPGAPNRQDYPVRLEVDYPESSSRGLALCAILFMFPKMLMLLPHLILLYLVSIATAVVVFLGYWVVLITGRYPRGLFDFVVGSMRWQTRVGAWLLGLVDKYPPFGMN